jgi:hypothetical protein
MYHIRLRGVFIHFQDEKSGTVVLDPIGSSSVFLTYLFGRGRLREAVIWYLRAWKTSLILDGSYIGIDKRNKYASTMPYDNTIAR